METVLAVLHILIALSLIGIILIQDPKGGSGGMFGGGTGSSSLLGATSAVSLLTRITRYLAIGFAFTCIGLALLTKNNRGSVTDQYVPQAAPALPGTAPVEGALPAASPGSTETAPGTDAAPGAGTAPANGAPGSAPAGTGSTAPATGTAPTGTAPGANVNTPPRGTEPADQSRPGAPAAPATGTTTPPPGTEPAGQSQPAAR